MRETFHCGTAYRGLENNVWVVKIYCVYYNAEPNDVEVRFRLNHEVWKLSKSTFKQHFCFENVFNHEDVGTISSLDQGLKTDVALDNVTMEMGNKHLSEILNFLKTQMGDEDYTLFEFSSSMTENSLEAFVGEGGVQSARCFQITASSNPSKKIPFEITNAATFETAGEDLNTYLDTYNVPVDPFTKIAKVPVVRDQQILIAEMSFWAFVRLQMQNGELDKIYTANWMQSRDFPLQIDASWRR